MINIEENYCNNDKVSSNGRNPKFKPFPTTHVPITCVVKKETNHTRKPTFPEHKKIDYNNQFHIDRPNFKIGTKKAETYAKDISNISKRGGDLRIIRPNFRPPSVAPRKLHQFEDDSGVAPGDPNMTGIESSLTNKATLISQPDPSDFEWLDQLKIDKAKYRTQFSSITTDSDKLDVLVADEIRRNPPLGRKQKMVMREMDADYIGKSNLNSEAKMKEILKLVTS
jgi:hypothetical protein